MTCHIGCDPGKHVSYFAMATGGSHLSHVWGASRLFEEGCSLTIEIPQVYRTQGRKSDPNDLIDLAVTAGRVIEASHCSLLQMIRPREWKGQLPKDACHARIREVLSASELDVLDHDLKEIPKSLRHNALDAVGVLLYGLGRRLR